MMKEKKTREKRDQGAGLFCIAYLFVLRECFIFIIFF